MRLVPLALGTSLIALSSFANAETMTVGLVAPLSGAGAAWGSAMKGALELAAKEVNGAGGLKVGGKSYEIKVAAYDDHYRPNDAVTAMNRLIFENNAKFVVGPLGSAPLLASLPLTTENKLITITGAFTPAAAAKEHPYSFRAILPTEVYAKPQIDWVVNKLGAKKVGGLFPNDETGQAMGNDLLRAYAKAGADFSAQEFYERERVDFVPLLTRVLAKGIDTFELDGTPPQTAGLLVKQLHDLGFQGNIIRTGGDATEDIMAVAGEGPTKNLYVHLEYDQSLKSAQDYKGRYVQAFGGSMNAFSPGFYTAIRMVLDAMQQAGTVDKADAIVAALAKGPEFDGPVGKANWIGEEFWGTKRQLFVPYAIGRARKGDPEVVATCTVQGCK